MIDTTARTYTQTRAARDLDRIRCGVAVCSCGGEYQPTADGRRQHRTLHGHTPTPAREDGAR